MVGVPTSMVTVPVYLLRANVCVFVGEFEPGQPVAAGKRNHIAELDIGGETGFVSVEVEKGPPSCPWATSTGPLNTFMMRDRL
jgi:hypothetical protein